jgi:hypothetical protein
MLWTGTLGIAFAVLAVDLPTVADADWSALRPEVERLLKDKSPLPAETTRRLRSLLDGKPKDESEAVAEVQRLLDAQCLLGVSINPESRVKAARGPARAELTLDRPVHVLVKIHNDGGVTHALGVDGEQLLMGKPSAGRWLEAQVLEPRKLDGRRVQYVVLKLTAREAGKREALLRFDVGQGTQDLGFRAEVPVLFTVTRP